MLHLIIKLIIKKGCIIMKKATTLLLSLGMLASTSAVIYGAIAEETKNSVYLPHNSWVVAELEEKMTAAHYEPAEGWQDKVSVGYDCVDSGAPNPETMSSVIQNSRGAGLYIPLKKEEEWPEMWLSVEVKFEKPYEVTDIVKAVSAEEQPTEGGHCKIILYNPVSGFETYDNEIAAMEGEQGNVPEAEFTFNAATKIYQANMGGYGYTFGYILEDDQGRRLFWCCKAANEFEKGKFYKLADVLNAYKEYKKRTTGISSWYTRWV